MKKQETTVVAEFRSEKECGDREEGWERVHIEQPGWIQGGCVPGLVFAT